MEALLFPGLGRSGKRSASIGGMWSFYLGNFAPYSQKYLALHSPMGALHFPDFKNIEKEVHPLRDF